jgi:hypothetical protein
MGITIKRLLGTFATGALWILCGVRLALDIIGWSTAPDDVKVAKGRAVELLNWVAQLPAWMPYMVATVLTMWMLYTSRSVAIVGAPVQSIQKGPEAKKISRFSSDIYSLKMKINAETGKNSAGRYPPDTNPITLTLSSNIRSVLSGLKSDGVPVPKFNQEMSVADAKFAKNFLDAIYAFVSRSQIEDVKTEAEIFLNKTLN